MNQNTAIEKLKSMRENGITALDTEWRELCLEHGLDLLSRLKTKKTTEGVRFE